MSSEKTNDPQSQMERMIAIFSEAVLGADSSRNIELEARFGTKGIKSITKIDFDNIVQKLISAGYELSQQQDVTLLRMSPEYVDTRTGQSRISNMRVELSGVEAVQKYCRTNTIEELQNSVACNFVIKKPLSIDGEILRPVDVDDWNFRLSMSEEQLKDNNGQVVNNTVKSWKDSKKIFRLITRNHLINTKKPLFRVDLSVVRESNRRGRFLVPAYTFESSGVTDNSPKYEVEIEMLPQGVKMLNYYYDKRPDEDTVGLLKRELKSLVLVILSALQETNFPISYPEQRNVLNEYFEVVHGEKKDEKKRIMTRDFIGPSSYTLSVNNIAPINPDILIPNIRENYTVTDKADGIRKLLLISGNGRVYFIDTNMKVQFSGAITNNKLYFNTLLDGEHILNDKMGRFINLYAAFDIYFINKKDIRKLPFVVPKDIRDTTEDKSELIKSYRLLALKDIESKLDLKSVTRGLSPVRVSTKTFYTADESQTIFQCCSIILRRVNEGLYEYETDGLIFTPTNLGVGMNSAKDSIKNVKKTWEHSFKWKPTEMNTIDFLVSTKKQENGQEFVGNIIQDGTNLTVATQIQQYKTLILRIGFNEKQHGYVNPCQDVIDDKIVTYGDKESEQDYRPMQFFPTSPYDPEAGICNVMLEGTTSDKVLMTKEGEVFGDNTIVEFSYDINRDKSWRWVPLRVRYDKTAEFIAGGRNYGNAYNVANSNWNSIHNPITVENITTGQGIPDELADDDVYYNRLTSDSLTKGLRDFHNKYVKSLLIKSTAKRGGTVIDMAVGKAGDLPKWIDARVAFVLGIDYSKDNIENRLDGACARYLNRKKDTAIVPDALFIHGDSTLNIRNGSALYTEKSKQIVKAVFGQGPKDATVLGKGVYKSYGKGSKGFDLTSIQFSIHYMFKDKVTANNLMRNISECTKVGGYFISTQYDGKTLFDSLRGLKQGESKTIIEDGRKIWEVTKRFDRADFTDDSSSLGYEIDVYQETINKVFTEYLVNYNYVQRLMEDYGFIPIESTEARRMGLKSSTGMFRELFDYMKNEMKNNPELKNKYGEAFNMSAGEKRISFLNRWMVFKKVRDVDTEQVTRNILGTTEKELLLLKDETTEATEVTKEAINESNPKIKPRKLKRRVKLVLMS